MKRFICLLTLAAVIALAPCALADGARVFDSGNLLTDSEERAITEAIADFQASTEMDFVVVTSTAEHDDASQQQIADNFFLRGNFGLGEEKDGILYYIDMYERMHYIATHGRMIDYMTDERIDDAISTCGPYLTRGDYTGAVQKMMSMVKGYINSGIPEGQYRYDVVTGQILTARHKALTSGEIAVSAIIAAAIGLIITMIVRSRYKLKGSTYEYDYRTNSSVDITDSTDDYIRTTTTRTRKAESNGGGSGGGGFGGGGGSGVHSSGGSSFGGGGGKF